ncbi:MAG: quinohemoprotein amine dehydrogenase subunit alpha [Burkholderiales bacterium]|nr:quinohemoprotein amine dehydrogenase subunit alpha [Burkholderiales bacterium]
MRHDWMAPLALGMALAAASGDAWTFDRDSLVRSKCGSCHVPTAEGRIPQVEDLRTTPEEWTVIVDRMHRLHDMPMGPGDMDRLLKELAATQGLTPDEQAQVAYLSLWHNSQQVEAPAGKEEEKVYATCVRCHTAGKIHSYRMTPELWMKHRDFHLYIVPTVVYQMREMRWLAEADAALAYFAKKLPYGKAWTAPPTKLEGAWAVFGDAPGRGTYRGRAQITDAGNAELKLSGSVTYSDGTAESFAGEGTLYGGYALRTRTSNNGFATKGAFIAANDEISGEWHLPAPDFRTSRSKWIRVGDQPKVARIVPGFLLAGEKTTVTVEGINLPDAKPSDITFAGGAVKVQGVRRIGPEALELTVVNNAPTLGTARVSVKGVDAGVVTLAPGIDRIAIVPEVGRARLSGGVHYPAEGVQFEAIAYAKRGIGKNAVAVALGPVPATFRLAELKTRPGDDDMTWLGTIRPNGAYLPMVDYAVNPNRSYQGENSGLVKVLARYKRGGRTYDAQARLAVTMPDYIARIR